MLRKCEYCGVAYEDSLPSCPSCAAPNEFRRETGTDVPRTIEELKRWYADRNLPPESVTRFFIGRDVSEPRAFGIYRKDEEVVVYKNKADGTRSIRYRGTDEAYGVNELYIKLKEDILQQKSQQRPGEFARPHVQRRAPKTIHLKTLLIAFFLLGISGTLVTVLLEKDGYYDINGNTYYYSDNNWYVWDEGWQSSPAPDYTGDLDDYRNEYDEDDEFSSFDDSDYSDDSDFWDDGDWDDNDYSWDSNDSWDSDWGGGWDDDW